MKDNSSRANGMAEASWCFLMRQLTKGCGSRIKNNDACHLFVYDNSLD